MSWWTLQTTKCRRSLAVRLSTHTGDRPPWRMVTGIQERLSRGLQAAEFCSSRCVRRASSVPASSTAWPSVFYGAGLILCPLLRFVRRPRRSATGTHSRATNRCVCRGLDRRFDSRLSGVGPADGDRLRGMTDQETGWLTDSMVARRSRRPVRHSGVKVVSTVLAASGDKISVILAPSRPLAVGSYEDSRAAPRHTGAADKLIRSRLPPRLNDRAFKQVLVTSAR